MSGREGLLGGARRGISRWITWWYRLPLIGGLVLAVAHGAGAPLPEGLSLPAILPAILAAVGLCLALACVTPPASRRPPVGVGAPVRGTWVALNSPGQAVPSHGTRAYGQAYAVDLSQPDPGVPLCEGWSLRGRRPEDSACFGQPVLAVGPGRVVAASGSQRDHRSRSTWPLLVGMLLIEGTLRQLAGVGWILGNHVIIEHEGEESGGCYSLYAHLRQGSLRVGVGERVEEGQQLAQVGSTGNSSMPRAPGSFRQFA